MVVYQQRQRCVPAGRLKPKQGESLMENKKQESSAERERRYHMLIRGYTLMNDLFMRSVLKDTDCTAYILQVILGQKDLRVVEQIIQKDYVNLYGRSLRLDCVVKDAAGRLFNVEVQRASRGAVPRRARYHSSLLDLDVVNPGDSFAQLPDTYVIFITESDVLQGAQMLYHIERTVQETKRPFQDGTYILYVNAGLQDESELGRLMHDFHCRSASEMYSPVLAQRVYTLKETERGRQSMTGDIKEIYEAGVMEGKAEGEAVGRAAGKVEALAEERLKMVMRIRHLMAQLQKSAEEAMDLLGISPEEQEIYKKQLL